MFQLPEGVLKAIPGAVLLDVHLHLWDLPVRALPVKVFVAQQPPEAQVQGPR